MIEREIGFEWIDENGTVYAIIDYQLFPGETEKQYVYQIRNLFKGMKYRKTPEEFETLLIDIEDRKQQKIREEQEFNAPEKPFVFDIELRVSKYKGKTWIAQIVDTDPKFKLKRVFLKPTQRHKSDGGYDLYRITEPGFYEFCSDGDKASVFAPKEGFVEIRNGIRRDVEYQTVIDAMENK